MNKIVIFGTGSFGQLAHFYFTRDSQYEVVAFTVSGRQLNHKEFMGLPVLAFEEIERYFPPQAFKMFIAVGYKKVNKVRAAVYTEAKQKGYELVTYVSSKCTFFGEIIGDNCFIFEDNTI